MTAVELAAPTIDDAVDDEIRTYLDPKAPRSFFLYAGAGAGKTRSLVKALIGFRELHGKSFRKSGRKVAVITYTNAACEEILSRVDKDPLFNVLTIHSFCWAQIGSFHHDIQEWVKAELPKDIAELEQQQAKGRAGSQAARDRERSIESKRRRLEWLSVPRRFTYNPNGDNFGRDSLGHTEVLKITGHFIANKPAMQAILVNRYPFLLIDESQDTTRFLINALFALEEANQGSFCLGLFGDTMQRIYPDGESNLPARIPKRWATPAKLLNHRSPQRIVRLGNALRAQVDNQRQKARDDSDVGVARLFISSANVEDKPEVEDRVRAEMANLTGDSAWTEHGTDVKTLTLEHHMAALRMGFGALFDALDQDSRVNTGLRNGELAGLRLFSALVAPLLEASKRGDDFTVMAILRVHSPLLTAAALKVIGDKTAAPLARVREAVSDLTSLDVDSPTTTFLNILNCISKHGLFDIPEILQPFASGNGKTDEATASGESDDEYAEKSTTSLRAWREFLQTPYKQIIPYAAYVENRGAFGTHQGVKGLEFDRVLVVMDDSGARGFSFSFEKLLGVKPLTDGDRKKMDKGEEIGIDRTRRLLYVTCTRAQQSLALMAYSEDPAVLEKAVIEQGLFEVAEIRQL